MLCKAFSRNLITSSWRRLPHNSFPAARLGSAVHRSQRRRCTTAAASTEPEWPGPALSNLSNMQPTIVIDEEDWTKLGSHIEGYDEQREKIIKRCRDSQKAAKGAVYSLHRGELKKAEAQLRDVENVAKELAPLLQQYPLLRMGSYAASMEEYAEAMAFLVFLREGRLIKSSEMPLVEPEEYLGGVLDMTGELNRYAVARATARDKAAVARCRDLVDGLMGRYLQFNFRNGALRKKFDALKYTLKKLENTLYELSLTEGLGLKGLASTNEEGAPASGGAGTSVEEEGA